MAGFLYFLMCPSGCFICIKVYFGVIFLVLDKGFSPFAMAQKCHSAIESSRLSGVDLWKTFMKNKGISPEFVRPTSCFLSYQQGIATHPEVKSFWPFKYSKSACDRVMTSPDGK